MTRPVSTRTAAGAVARLTATIIAVGLCLQHVVGAATFSSTGSDAARQAIILDELALEALVSPIALYPDELLAIVLPASTYPLQIVQAARFIEARQSNPDLEPDGAWDETIVALLNYPEALALLNSDLDWTADLGQAVLNQETALVRAIGTFRERAYAAGNLRSDEYKQVQKNAEVIEVTSAETDALYVPYYDPRAVIVPQSTPVYRYYTTRYPLYYYPYASQHYFFSNPFWGLTTAYTIGWGSRRIHYHRHAYRSHPYHHKRYARARYRSHASRDPRHRLHAGPTHYRTYRGDNWGVRRHRYDRQRGYPSNLYRRQRPSHFADGGHTSDRLRSGHRHDNAAHRDGGDRHRNSSATGPRRNGGTARANNGALGNGSTASQDSTARAANGLLGNGNRARTKSARPLKRPDAVVAKFGNSSDSRSLAPRRSQGAGTSKQTRASGNISRRENPRARAPSARTQGAQKQRRTTARSGIRGSKSTRRDARAPARAIGSAFRGNAGNQRTQRGSAFLGNGGSRSRR